MSKRIVLCADDYGQAEPISLAIIDLLKRDRLTAVSCMVTAGGWFQHAPWLLPFKHKVDIGLHFNLTEGKPISKEYRERYGDAFSSLSTLMVKALLHQLDVEVLQAELRAQIAAFQANMGALPAFIDGHQHVHQFPQVREAVIAIYQECFNSNQHYIRLVRPSINKKNLYQEAKKVIVRWWGGNALQQRLRQQNIKHNTSFSGMYHFAKASDYASLFPQFLHESKEGGLIMCHPGFLGDKATDGIAKARFHEYQYLASEQFLLDSRLVEYVTSQSLTMKG